MKRSAEQSWTMADAAIALAMFCVGVFLFFRFDAIPGDIGDTRFNMCVLEHGFRWIKGIDQSFWSAHFFYPANNVIAYSDNHLGTVLFYTFFRFLGCDRETAYQGWAFVIFSLNYFLTLI